MYGKGPHTDYIRPDVAALVSLCRTTIAVGVLPSTGGLLDQDFVFALALSMVAKWDGEKSKIEEAKQKAKAKNATRPA